MGIIAALGGIKVVAMLVAALVASGIVWRWWAKKKQAIRDHARREIVDEVNEATDQAKVRMEKEVAHPTTKKQTKKRLDDGTF